MNLTLKEENIAGLIHFIRGEKVMLDSDIAILYGVENKALKRAVRRNIDRFPEDFMFELTKEEYEIVKAQILSLNLRSQIGTSSWGGARYAPMAFTEQGVSMLSGILRSQRAVEVNIAIIRTFVQLRKLMNSNKDLALKIEALEKKYDENFKVVFQAIKQLIQQKNEPRVPAGFKVGNP